jgi:hypothetical protein
MHQSNKIDHNEVQLIHELLEEENMPETKSVENRIVCITCGKDFANAKTLSIHVLKTCGNEIKRTQSHKDKLALVQLKKRTEEMEEKIIKAEEMLNDSHSNKQVIKATGLKDQQVSNIKVGLTFSTTGKSDEELIDQIHKFNEKQGNKTPNQSKMDRRSYTSETMYNILMNRKDGPAQLSRDNKKKDGTNMTQSSIRRILEGSVKMLPEDYDILGITEEDYNELIS